MKRIRVAGLIKIGNGFAFMHRKNVKKSDNPNKPYGEYYVFVGGGLEENETLEEGTKREIKEELGIDVNVLDLLYTKDTDELEQKVFLCEYVDGTFATGKGPEFSHDPRYKDRGDYIPEIIPFEKVKDIRLIPEIFKNMLVKDIKSGKFH